MNDAWHRWAHRYLLNEHTCTYSSLQLKSRHLFLKKHLNQKDWAISKISKVEHTIGLFTPTWSKWVWSAWWSQREWQCLHRALPCLHKYLRGLGEGAKARPGGCSNLLWNQDLPGLAWVWLEWARGPLSQGVFLKWEICWVAQSLRLPAGGQARTLRSMDLELFLMIKPELVSFFPFTHMKIPFQIEDIIKIIKIYTIQ